MERRTTRGSSEQAKKEPVKRQTKKSPARPVKEAIKEEAPHSKSRGRPKKEVDKSPKRKSPRVTEDLDQPSPTRRTRSKLLTSDSSSSIQTTKTVTLSAGNVISDDSMSKRSVSRTPATELSLNRSLSREFSDNESREEREKSSMNRRSMSRELQDRAVVFSAKYSAALFLTLVPLMTQAIVVSCSEKRCSPGPNFLKDLSSFNWFFNLQTAVVYILFTTFVTLASVVPLGRIVEISSENGYKEFTFNGFATAILAVLSVAFGEKVGVVDRILTNYHRILILAIFQAYAVAFWSFIRATYSNHYFWNPFAKSGRKLGDYFIGREIAPRWFNTLDAKLAYYRIAVITALIFNAIFLFKSVSIPDSAPDFRTEPLTVLQAVKYDKTAVAVASMVIVYCFDLLIFEHHLTSSFDLQNEGFGGLFLVRLGVFPFLISAVPKYIIDNNIEANCWTLTVSALIFLTGLVIKRTADQIKYSYRLDAENPKLQNLETLPTFQGQNIIVGNLWGIVRHPNHLGEILIFASFLPLLCQHFAWAPLVAVLYLILFMVHRAVRVDQRSDLKYNSAWRRYTSRVPYHLMPRVF